MKKIICTILVVVLTVLPILGFSHEDEVIDILLLYDEDFDFVEPGGTPTSGTAIPKNNLLTVEQAEACDSMALRYEVISESDMYYEYDTSASKNCVIEFDIMLERKGVNGFVVYFKDTAGSDVKIISINKNGELCRTDGTAIAQLVEGKFYSICINVTIETCLADVYVNHKKKASDISLSPASFDGVSKIRYRIPGSSADGNKPIIYIDNLRSYDAPFPIFHYEEAGINLNIKSSFSSSGAAVASASEVSKYMKNTIALYVGQNRIAIDGESEYFDKDDKNVKVYLKNDRAFVPVRFVSEALGYDVEYNADESAVVIMGQNKEIKLISSSDYCEAGSEKIRLDAPAEIVDNRMFVPVRAVCEFFGKKLTYDKSGMIVIADREDFFDMREDLGVFRYIAGQLVFDNPSGAEMISELKNRYPNNTHPRLFFNSAELEDLKREITVNPTMQKWQNDVIKSADSMLNLPLTEYEIYDGIRLYERCNTVKERVRTCAFVYLMTGEDKYAQKAVDELMNACGWKDWNPYHFLDTSEMMTACAIGYDWLYDYLTAEQRVTMCKAITEKGFKPAMEDYNDTPGRERTVKWTMQTKSYDNWDIICNGGAIVSALAFGDDVSMAEDILDAGMKCMQGGVLMYAPDGAWFEGPGYWHFGTVNYVDFADVLCNVFDDDFGFLQTPGIAETGHFINAMMSASGTFGFHDSGQSRINSPEIFFFADKCSDPSLAQNRLNDMELNGITASVRDFLFYDYNVRGNRSELATDYYYRETEVAAMTSGWNGNNEIYVGVHAGKVNVTHGQMDVGQFIIDAYDTRYAVDMGKDDYNLPGSVWNQYRSRAEGHNTLVINPSSAGGQNTLGDTVINRFESGQGCAFAVIDMTSAYSTQAHSIKRGIKLTNNRSAVIIQDEIQLREPSEIYWFMHTQCDIEVASDGKCAILKGKYRDMHVYLLEDVDGVFSVMPAQPLPTSPVVEGQNENKKYQKLTFRVENVTDMTLAVACSFEVPNAKNPELYKPEIVPLENWELDISKGIKKPKLHDLRINGKTVEGFSPDTLGYTYRMTSEEEAPVIEAAAGEDTEVTITVPDEFPGSAVVTVRAKSDKKVKESYVIKIDKEVLSQGPDGTTQLSVVNVEASDVPQAENAPLNTLDRDLSTRWSAEGNSHIIYDLGSTKKVSNIGIAIYRANAKEERKQYFDICLSSDGDTWEVVYSGETSGITDDLEFFAIPESLCRYVKINCKGTSVGEWNSITECAVYGSK